MEKKASSAPSLQELYPELSEEELQEAEENLERYLGLALRVHERIRSDPKAYARFKRLTGGSGGCYEQDAKVEPSSSRNPPSTTP